jgi:acrylyl-CoA reductase (NADPH)
LKPLAKARFAGAVDSVGSLTLANVLSQINPEGTVAATGLAQGMDLPASMAPFILRGVKLIGVNSVTCPYERRVEAWRRLAADLDRNRLASMTQHIKLGDIPRIAEEIVVGKVRGRVVVDL